jgi:hypothetical protein
MEHGQERLEHPRLDVVTESRAGGLEQADGDVVAEARRDGDEGLVADTGLATQEPRQLARVHAGRPPERPQAEPLHVENTPDLLSQRAALGRLLFPDVALEPALAHVGTSRLAAGVGA